MTAHRIGYRRVSTTDQSTARQLDGVALDQTFEDHASGSTTDRPQLQACMATLRPGDTLVVHSMDRLARNLQDLLALVSTLTARGVRVEFIKEAQTFTGSRSATGDLMLGILGAVAGFERAMIRERQAEGIAIAKQRGVYKGRKPALDAVQVAKLRAAAQVPGVNRSKLAKDFGISRETMYQHLRV